MGIFLKYLSLFFMRKNDLEMKSNVEIKVCVNNASAIAISESGIG